MYGAMLQAQGNLSQQQVDINVPIQRMSMLRETEQTTKKAAVWDNGPNER